LDANGKRIANELGRRDYVTGEMWKSKPPFRLVLNKASFFTGVDLRSGNEPVERAPRCPFIFAM